MKIKYLILPGYFLFLLAMARLVWSPVDSELASFKAITFPAPLLSDKIAVTGIFALLLPFLLAVRRPWKSLGILSFVLLAIAAASLAWTYDLTSTIYILIPLFSIFGYALAVSALWGPERALLFIWLVGSAIIIVSGILAVAGDPHALMGGRHDGAWRGLFAHKNGLGPFIVTHLLITLFGRSYMRLPLVASLAIAALDFIVLLQANSGTATIAAVAALCAGAAFIPFRHGGVRTLWRFGMIFLLVIGVTVVALNVQQVFDLLGRDATLTNRTDLWAIGYDMSLRHVLGTGYGTGGGTQMSIELQKLTGRYDAIGVQSGYIHMALELGWISVAIFVVWLLSAVFQAVFFGRNLAAQALFVALVVQHLIGSFSESFGCLYPSWSLMVVVTALIAVRAEPSIQSARRTSPRLRQTLDTDRK